MASKISIKIINGDLAGKKYGFEEPMLCVIGRSPDCSLCLPGNNAKQVSWIHCALNVKPPFVTIKDLQSSNGTFLNGSNVCSRPLPDKLFKRKVPDAYEFNLRDGDFFQIGEVVFEVSINIPYRCSFCSCAIDKHQLDVAERRPGYLVCDKCFGSISHSLSKTALLNRDEDGDNDNEVFDMLKTARIKAFTRSQFFSDKYKIIRTVGKGGMSLVYLVKNLVTGEKQALKILLPEVATEEYAVEQFLREVDYACQLKHPNIVESYEYGDQGESFFLAMEYCNGGTVNDLMRQQKGWMNVDEAMPIFFQVLDALDYAHNVELPSVKLIDNTYSAMKGIVHRDVKPVNIFIKYTDDEKKNYIPKIGDFGLAKAFEKAGMTGNTSVGIVMGALGFISRTQLNNYKYAKPEVDLWALVATLYFMLTCRYPREFANRSPLEAVLKTMPVPIRTHRSSVPKKLAKLIDEALLDDRELMFKRAVDVKKAFEKVI